MGNRYSTKDEKQNTAEERSSITHCEICKDHLAKATEHGLAMLKKCHHAFHTECLVRCIYQCGAKCPLCRRSFSINGIVKLVIKLHEEPANNMISPTDGTKVLFRLSFHKHFWDQSLICCYGKLTISANF